MELSCGHCLKFEKDGSVEFAAHEIGHQKDPDTLENYNELFEALGNSFAPQRVLEIGVWHGGSLAMWREIFGCEILGVDVQNLLMHPARDHIAEDGRIKTLWMRAPDQRLGALGEFDLIIDDGGHGPEVVPPTFDILWKSLRKGGIYVIEDWRADFCMPKELVGFFLDKIRGYWPGPADPAAPAKMTLWRSMFALEKR
jgi:predicted O-methyltransferase YrrM